MRSFLTAILTRYARQHIKSFNNVLYLMKSNTILHCFRIKKKVPNILDLLHEDFIPAVLFHRYMVDILPIRRTTRQNQSLSYPPGLNFSYFPIPQYNFLVIRLSYFSLQIIKPRCMLISKKSKNYFSKKFEQILNIFFFKTLYACAVFDHHFTKKYVGWG